MGFIKSCVFRHSFFYEKNGCKKLGKLNFYYVDMKYIRDLANADSNVLSVSPQDNKQTRPFVGVILV